MGMIPTVLEALSNLKIFLMMLKPRHANKFWIIYLKLNKISSLPSLIQHGKRPSMTFFLIWENVPFEEDKKRSEKKFSNRIFFILNKKKVMLLLLLPYTKSFMKKEKIYCHFFVLVCVISILSMFYDMNNKKIFR